LVNAISETRASKSEPFGPDFDSLPYASKQVRDRWPVSWIIDLANVVDEERRTAVASKLIEKLIARNRTTDHGRYLERTARNDAPGGKKDARAL